MHFNEKNIQIGTEIGDKMTVPKGIVTLYKQSGIRLPNKACCFQYRVLRKIITHVFQHRI